MQALLAAVRKNPAIVGPLLKVANAHLFAPTPTPRIAAVGYEEPGDDDPAYWPGWDPRQGGPDNAEEIAELAAAMVRRILDGDGREAELLGEKNGCDTAGCTNTAQVLCCRCARDGALWCAQCDQNTHRRRECAGRKCLLRNEGGPGVLYTLAIDEFLPVGVAAGGAVAVALDRTSLQRIAVPLPVRPGLTASCPHCHSRHVEVVSVEDAAHTVYDFPSSYTAAAVTKVRCRGKKGPAGAVCGTEWELPTAPTTFDRPIASSVWPLSPLRLRCVLGPGAVRLHRTMLRSAMAGQSSEEWQRALAVSSPLGSQPDSAALRRFSVSLQVADMYLSVLQGHGQACVVDAVDVPRGAVDCDMKLKLWEYCGGRGDEGNPPTPGSTRAPGTIATDAVDAMRVKGIGASADDALGICGHWKAATVTSGVHKGKAVTGALAGPCTHQCVLWWLPITTGERLVDHVAGIGIDVALGCYSITGDIVCELWTHMKKQDGDDPAWSDGVLQAIVKRLGLEGSEQLCWRFGRDDATKVGSPNLYVAIGLESDLPAMCAGLAAAKEAAAAHRAAGRVGSVQYEAALARSQALDTPGAAAAPLQQAALARALCGTTMDRVREFFRDVLAHPGTPVVRTMTLVLGDVHAPAHACKAVYGGSSAPGVGRTREVAEQTFGNSRITDIAPRLSHMTRAAWEVSWDTHFHRYNQRRNAACAEFLLSLVLARRRDLSNALARVQKLRVVCVSAHPGADISASGLQARLTARRDAYWAGRKAVKAAGSSSESKMQTLLRLRAGVSALEHAIAVTRASPAASQAVTLAAVLHLSADVKPVLGRKPITTVAHAEERLVELRTRLSQVGEAGLGVVPADTELLQQLRSLHASAQRIGRLVAVLGANRGSDLKAQAARTELRREREAAAISLEYVRRLLPVLTTPAAVAWAAQYESGMGGAAAVAFPTAATFTQKGFLPTQVGSVMLVDAEGDLDDLADAEELVKRIREELVLLVDLELPSALRNCRFLREGQRRQIVALSRSPPDLVTGSGSSKLVPASGPAAPARLPWQLRIDAADAPAVATVAAGMLAQAVEGDATLKALEGRLAAALAGARALPVVTTTPDRCDTLTRGALNLHVPALLQGRLTPVAWAALAAPPAAPGPHGADAAAGAGAGAGADEEGDEVELDRLQLLADEALLGAPPGASNLDVDDLADVDIDDRTTGAGLFDHEGAAEGNGKEAAHADAAMQPAGPADVP
jgi:hypothetical protein